MTSDKFIDDALQMKSLYSDLIASVKDFDNGKLVPFCMQWGALYPTAPHEGIMFYGRATNRWVTTDLNEDNLFDIHNSDRIFARDDQMVLLLSE